MKRLLSTIPQNTAWIKAECEISFDRDKAAKADYDEMKQLAGKPDRQRHVDALTQKVLRCLELNLALLPRKNPLKFISFTLSNDDIKARKKDVLTEICSDLYESCEFLIVALRIENCYYTDHTNKFVTIEFAVYG